MEEKTAKDIAAQLKRIADALIKTNTLTESDQKRRLALDNLEERKLRNDLRESLSQIDPEKVIKTSPRLEGK